MKKILSLIIITIVLIGCSNNKNNDEKTRTITYQDQELVVKDKIEKVVILDMATLDIIDYLSLEDKVVGLAKTSLPSYLKKYNDDKYAATGDFFEPDFEKISELNPDLIIIGGRSEGQLDKLKEIAPTILLISNVNDYYNSFINNAKVLGEIFDKSKEVDQKLLSIDNEINEFKQKVNQDLKTLVVMTSENKISVYGAQSRFALIHDILKIPMADSNIEDSRHGQSVNYEYINKTNPDLIYALDRDYAIKSTTKIDNSVLDNELVKQTKASINKEIHYLDGEAWYITGLSFQSFDIMMKDLQYSFTK
ncbi:MAG: siderophore ABC transporter substrate-binding protein [Bacilli bacterium]